jgi:hypothetical protein
MGPAASLPPSSPRSTPRAAPATPRAAPPHILTYTRPLRPAASRMRSSLPGGGAGRAAGRRPSHACRPPAGRAGVAPQERFPCRHRRAQCQLVPWRAPLVDERRPPRPSPHAPRPSPLAPRPAPGRSCQSRDRPIGGSTRGRWAPAATPGLPAPRPVTAWCSAAAAAASVQVQNVDSKALPVRWRRAGAAGGGGCCGSRVCVCVWGAARIL